MFVEEGGSDPSSSGNHGSVARSIRELLVACAVEAKRQAAEVESLDGLVGEILLGGGVAVDPQALQKLDLLRQEADGLANVLQMVAAQMDQDGVVDPAAVTACLPLAAQRARIATQGNNL